MRQGVARGTHTREDYITVHKKANALASCYIDSSISPRVHVNVPGSVVSNIIKEIAKGRITYSLFHEAALHIFTILITYWKKFCIER